LVWASGIFSVGSDGFVVTIATVNERAAETMNGVVAVKIFKTMKLVGGGEEYIIVTNS
jgi:hypothetical protein